MTDTSWLTGTWPICRPTYWSTLGRYVDRYIGWVLVDITTNTLVVGCAKYTWSPSSRLVLSSGPSQDPKMKPKLTLEWYQSSQIIHWIISSSICKLDQINSMCEITHQIVVSNNGMILLNKYSAVDLTRIHNYLNKKRTCKIMLIKVSWSTVHHKLHLNTVQTPCGLISFTTDLICQPPYNNQPVLNSATLRHLISALVKKSFTWSK